MTNTLNKAFEDNFPPSVCISVNLGTNSSGKSFYDFDPPSSTGSSSHDQGLIGRPGGMARWGPNMYFRPISTKLRVVILKRLKTLKDERSCHDAKDKSVKVEAEQSILVEQGYDSMEEQNNMIILFSQRA